MKLFMMQPGPRRRALHGAIAAVDGFMEAVSRAFLVVANVCLLLMLIGTAATIVLRPFGRVLLLDLAVDDAVLRLGSRSSASSSCIARARTSRSTSCCSGSVHGAMSASRVFVKLVVMAVTGAILWQMPTILASQVGVIDGVVTPWGELERYTLSVPLGVSTALIFANSALDLGKAWSGIPETIASHRTDPDS